MPWPTPPARSSAPISAAPLAVDNKAATGAFDPVTEADRLPSGRSPRPSPPRWPEHGFIGEEHGTTRPMRACAGSSTRSTAPAPSSSGCPMWGTLIGLLDGEAPVLGLMDQPFTRERFWSGTDGAFMRTGRRRAADPDARLRQPRRGDPDDHAPRPVRCRRGDGRLRPPEAQVRMTRYGGDCYAYCLLAAGFVDLIVEAGLKSYDIVALIPIIERAGGRITTWDGEPATAGGRIVAAGDPRLHDASHGRAVALKTFKASQATFTSTPKISVESRPEARAHGVVLLQDLVLGAGHEDARGRPWRGRRSPRSPASRRRYRCWRRTSAAAR